MLYLSAFVFMAAGLLLALLQGGLHFYEHAAAVGLSPLSDQLAGMTMEAEQATCLRGFATHMRRSAGIARGRSAPMKDPGLLRWQVEQAAASGPLRETARSFLTGVSQPVHARVPSDCMHDLAASA
jgi:hypothetical protein